MAFCEKCGKPVYRLDKTCVNCGAPVTQFSNATYDGGRSSSSFSLDSDPGSGSPYEVLSSWGFVGSMLLMSLPVVGFVMTIIWASGGTVNLNRRNLARGYLILMAIGVVLYILFAIILVSTTGSTMLFNNLIH